jgi:hypothetical protein
MIARLALALGVAIACVACGGSRTEPLPAFPARVDAQCFTPGPEDYSVTIVVRDTMYRDTAWLRPLLDGVGGVWRVETPLRKLSVDVGATFSRDGEVHDIHVVRRSGFGDFDQRALRAVEITMQSNERPLPERYTADSLRILVRFGPPNVQNALVQTWLSVVRPPRPKRGNPAPDYPADRRAGQRVTVIVLVDSLGIVDPESIEVAETTDEDFARAVVDVLPKWRFTPSMVRGCRVSRSVRLDFTDKNPE